MTKSVFTQAYDAIDRSIPFDSRWNNGTGYFNGAACEAIAGVAPGEMVKSYTGDLNRRRLIIIGLPETLGNLVMFDRYTDAARGVIVFNVDYSVEVLLDMDAPLSDEKILFLTGPIDEIKSGHMNVGKRLKSLLTTCAREREEAV